MIFCPLAGECNVKVIPNPKSCFLMIEEQKDEKPDIEEVTNAIKEVCKRHDFNVIIATKRKKERDFLCKICELIQSVPFGIAFYTNDTDKTSLGNIFYECGYLHSLGKDLIVIKHKNVKILSNLVRSEYIEYETIEEMKKKLLDHIKHIIVELGPYFEKLGDMAYDAGDIEKAFFYYKKSFLIEENDETLEKIKRVKNLLEKIDPSDPAIGLKNRIKEEIDIFIRLLPLSISKKRLPKISIRDKAKNLARKGIHRGVFVYYKKIFEWLLEPRKLNRLYDNKRVFVDDGENLTFRGFYPKVDYVWRNEDERVMTAVDSEVRLTEFGKMVLKEMKSLNKS